MKRVILYILVFVISGCIPVFAAFDHDHGVWDILLKKHVVMKDQDRQSSVDYKGFKNDSALFITYLTSLSIVRMEEYGTWTKDRQLAYLINAYNAFTIKLIIDNYPVESIRDIGGLFSSPWKIEFIPLLGKQRSLDEIEHQMIRQKGVFDDPRIHVALVCAAKGCPALQNRAFTGDALSGMLDTAMTRFLSDSTRNRFNAEKKRFEISHIFDWYRDDFKDKYGSLERFLTDHAQTLTQDPESLAVISSGSFKVDFLDYDWNLNDY